MEDIKTIDFIERDGTDLYIKQVKYQIDGPVIQTEIFGPYDSLFQAFDGPIVHEILMLLEQ